MRAGLPGKVPHGGSPFLEDSGDSRGRQGLCRDGLRGQGPDLPVPSLLPWSHVTTLVSVSREQARRFYSGDEAAGLRFLLDEGLQLKEHKDRFFLAAPFLLSLWAVVSVAQWEWPLKPSSCFSPK